MKHVFCSFDINIYIWLLSIAHCFFSMLVLYRITSLVWYEKHAQNIVQKLVQCKNFSGLVFIVCGGLNGLLVRYMG